MDREQILEDLKQWLWEAHFLKDELMPEHVLEKIDELEEEYE